MTPATGNYADARRIWGELRQGLEGSPQVLDELLKALGALVSEYDTTVPENRFIVGGAVERILAATLRCIGKRETRARGYNLDEEDLIVGEVQLSVKCSFTGRRDAIRLINTLGNSIREWRAGTIFVLANRGIGYADPGLLPGETETKRDAVVLPRKPLDAFHESHPWWLLSCAVPAKQKDASQRRAASEAIATEIIQRTSAGQPMFPKLRHFL